MSRWQTHCPHSHQGKQRPTSPTSHSHNNVNIPEVRVVRKSDTPIPPAPKVALNKTIRSKKQRPKAREEREWANEKIKYFSHQKMPIKDSLPRESLRVPLATTRLRSLASIESSISGHALTMSAGPLRRHSSSSWLSSSSSSSRSRVCSQKKRPPKKHVQSDTASKSKTFC